MQCDSQRCDGERQGVTQEGGSGSGSSGDSQTALEWNRGNLTNEQFLAVLANACRMAWELSRDPEWTVVDACHHVCKNLNLDDKCNALVELVVTYCPERGVKTFAELVAGPVPPKQEPQGATNEGPGGDWGEEWSNED